MSECADRVRALIRDVVDFPKPGIVFKDLTPVLSDGEAFASIVDALVERFEPMRPTRVVGIEARGFILGAPVAYRLRAGFVPARKKGKLPWQTESIAYELEYGTENLELHRDALGPDDRVLLIDDVLATGGTAAAALSLVAQLGAEVVGAGFIIELGFLNGRSKLTGVEPYSLVTY
ncbi:MAG TPA: adenine phosphoribosyltransferase [Actinomycetota bacterium]|nr:adenine phosphoribosyltransferase [Actinomycetota bacterium]